MHTLFENAKVGLVCSPQLKDNGVATVTYIDTAGWNHATLLLAVGALDATLDAKLQESDASGSGYADITDAEITQLDADDDDKMVAIEVKLDGPRKRYLKPVITAGDGATGVNVAAAIILTRGAATPADAAGAGLAELVKV